MKQLLTIVFFLSFSLDVFSQILVSNVKMNIVYAGVDNPIEFLVNNIDKNKLVIKASCGELVRQLTAKYIWRLCNAHCHYVTFSIGVIKNNHYIKIDSSDFRIFNVPIPSIQFGSTPESRANSHAGNFPKHPKYGPQLFLDTFDFDVRFKVHKFDVDITLKGDTVKFTNIGLEFNEIVKKEIEKLGLGDRICVSNIVYSSGCTIEKLKLQKIFMLCLLTAHAAVLSLRGKPI